MSAADFTPAMRAEVEALEDGVPLDNMEHVAKVLLARYDALLSDYEEAFYPALEETKRELEQANERLRRLGGSWLTKDFNVLYRCAQALADACNGRGDGRPYPPLKALEAQLERLRPAFTDSEEVRRLMRERGQL